LPKVSKSIPVCATECSPMTHPGAAGIGCLATLSTPGSISARERETVQTVNNPVSVTASQVSSANIISTLANHMGVSVPTVASNLSVSQTICTSPPAATSLTSKQLPTVCNVNVAPYKKPVASSAARSMYTTPTYLIRNGHKVQCVSMPPKALTANQIVYVHPPEAISPPTGLL